VTDDILGLHVAMKASRLANLSKSTGCENVSLYFSVAVMLRVRPLPHLPAER